MIGAATCDCGQALDCCHTSHCPRCGTTLFFASTVCPGEIHVARPAIPGPIDREPQCHVFYDQHAEWIEVGDTLPRYATDDPGLAKFKAVGRPD